MTRYYEMNMNVARQNSTDFVHRKRYSGLWQSILFYIIGAIAIIIASFYRDIIGGDIPFIMLTMLVIGLLTFHSLLTVQRHLDLVLSIEFQNALFSSAFKDGKIFSIIVSQDDQLFYADPGFNELYPKVSKQNSQILDSIVQRSDTPQENLDALNHALIQKDRASMDIYINLEGEKSKARLTITPLTRPNGYFFVSARLYQEHRSEPAQTHQNSEAVLLYTLSQHMSDAVYILNKDKNIVHATHPLISALGYDKAQDIHNIPITNLLFNYKAKEDSDDVMQQPLQDATVSFRKKTGAIMQASLTQHPITGLEDYTLGIISFIE